MFMARMEIQLLLGEKRREEDMFIDRVRREYNEEKKGGYAVRTGDQVERE